jgi:hypothetical protein
VATSHRVRKVTEERYSFPLFCTLDYHAVLGPLPRLLAPGEEPRPSLVAGEHLFAQTAQTFTYLKKRVAVGELALPAQSLALSSFGQEARQRPALSCDDVDVVDLVVAGSRAVADDQLAVGDGDDY